MSERQDAVEVSPGVVFDFDYPFVRDTTTLFDEAGPHAALTWRPGIRHVPVYPDSGEAIFDALGRQVATVVDVHKPGKYPTRVFFTREWRDPDGKAFGKSGKLRITTLQAFRALIGGYRHDARVATEDEVADYEADLREQIAKEAEDAI